MSDTDDTTIARYRAEITELDRQIVRAVNRRLELVAGLKRHKGEQGIGFVDPKRERELAEELVAWNPGPLSEDGLRKLHAELLALVKRELG
jgi:chorismate mutase